MSKVLGIIGGGQLGMMLTEAAQNMKSEISKVIVLDPTENCPAKKVGAEQIVADFKDEESIKKLSEVSDDEWKNKKQTEQEYMIKDDRVNHMSPENHSIMYEIIKKIIDYDEHIPEFKKNIIDN